MLYSVDFSPTRPLTEDDLARSKSFRGIHTENIPGTDRAVATCDNDYLIDRALQASGNPSPACAGSASRTAPSRNRWGRSPTARIEHLGISDTAIVKIRRLLLQTLKDHAAGKPLPGLDPASYRVRSARFGRRGKAVRRDDGRTRPHRGA